MRGAFKNKVYLLVINLILISDFFLEPSPAKSVADSASTDTASIYLSIYLICSFVFALEEITKRVAAFPIILAYTGLPESEG